MADPDQAPTESRRARGRPRDWHDKTALERMITAQPLFRRAVGRAGDACLTKDRFPFKSGFGGKDRF